MFKSLFGGRGEGIPPNKLPQLHSFVDVMVVGRPVQSVTVDSIGPKGIVTRDALGRVGESAVLVYNAQAGRFRAETKILAVTATSTQFETPRKITLIGAATGMQKRQSVRLDTIVSGEWRLAPSGVGVGEFAKATIRDISRGGCSLIMDREVKLHSSVEVRMKLRPEGPPLTLLGEVMRHEQIKTSGKQSHGLRFHGLRPDEDQAIVEFINRRQADLRNRGLA
jgi:c-di-GMP-binding flagellar brake protein YcgR